MKKTFILVWIEEEEKWYYFKEQFDEKQFKYGYTDYEIEVDSNGVITKDTYHFKNIGKKFADVYCEQLWEVA